MWDALDEELDETRGRERGPDAGERCTVKSRYIHNDDTDARHQLAVQVRYIAVEDPRDPPDQEARQLFTEGDTGITGKEARGMIWQNRSMKGAVCFHRLILSPSTGLGIKTRAEAQEWTRVVMRDLSVQVDRELTWVAGCHTNRSHTHVHIGCFCPTPTNVKSAQGFVKLFLEHRAPVRRIAVASRQGLKIHGGHTGTEFDGPE